jgi:tRNA threonylcarbamoyladenosine biosynthesis protein TsaE
MIFVSHSEEETRNFAKNLAKKNKTQVVALIGELGYGKTIFAQGFAQGLGIKEKVISPTFILVRAHPIPKKNKTFYHLDLYRLEQKSEIEHLVKEILENPNNILLIEWAEKVESILPKNSLRIKLEKVSEFERKINLS